MSRQITGSIGGLKSSQLKALEKLYARRVSGHELITQDFATHLTFLSQELNRLVGVLVNRKGKVEHVIVGDVYRLYLPDIGRQRGGSGRFRGLRLIRAHLQGEPLTREDLTDLSKLKLDAIVSVEVGPAGYPDSIHWAHMVPDNPEGQLWHTYTVKAVSELNLSFEAFIAELEGEFSRKADTLVETGGEAAFLVMPDLSGRRAVEVEIAEMLELARTADLDIRDIVVQRRAEPDPRFVVGKGKLEDLVLQALQQDVGLLVFGVDLQPRQLRAITDATELRVVDRTQLILDIFASRASSAEGKLQVELALLKYTLPRLVAKNTGMSRLAGHIGGRGPGETKLEINRRRAHDRIRHIEERLEKVANQRAQRRSRRNRNEIPILSIVGYTNAGKSTLLNSLTMSDVLSEDKLFATLAPATRRLRFPEEREVVLTDTVGFIQDLPQDLVNAFMATLEELADADLLLHIVDASTRGFEDRIKAVNKILDGLGLADKPQLLVFNKSDLLEPGEADSLAAQHHAIAISALERESARPLMEEIDRRIFFEGRPWQEELAAAAPQTPLVSGSQMNL